MHYKQLGRAGLRVSPLCLGTVNFGWLTTEADSFAILDAAFEAGINFIDTSDSYSRGLTETIIGRWLKARPGRRDQIVLATKVYSRMTAAPNDRGLSAYHIRRACEASLKRLGVDHIDLYQMHHVDRDVTWEEIWQAMEGLVQSGKISYVGSSNFAGWHIAQANEVAKSRHFMGLISEQSYYNLTNRTVELEILPAVRGYGMGLIPYSPLESGVLAGKRPRPEPSEAEVLENDAGLQAIIDQLTDYKDLPALLAEVSQRMQRAIDAVVTNPAPDTRIVQDDLLRVVTDNLLREGKLYPGEVGDVFYNWVRAARGSAATRQDSREAQKTAYERSEQIAAYVEFCEAFGHAPADVALAWLIHQPGVAAPIVGPRTLAHLEGNLRALTLQLDAEALARLDKIWPGPGGPAPEAFAW